MYEYYITSTQIIMTSRLAISSFSVSDSPELDPQNKIPNVRKFKVKLLSNDHPTFLKHKIKKRESESLLDRDPT
jgi:hypothetical protein